MSLFVFLHSSLCFALGVDPPPAPRRDSVRWDSATRTHVRAGPSVADGAQPCGDGALCSSSSADNNTCVQRRELAEAAHPHHVFYTQNKHHHNIYAHTHTPAHTHPHTSCDLCGGLGGVVRWPS
mmetsp:Transcript_12201/g.21695  ORF Transcript_12201/g.21695 Transcript_12201/m.21695 type:complete len:124 (+) Transcript_12201:388-759(+)